MADFIFPHNESLEQKVLGILLSSPDKTIEFFDELKAATFYVSSHKAIWLVLVNALKQDRKIDIVLFEEEFKRVGFNKDDFDEMGGINYLLDLIDGAVSSVPLLSYVKELKELENKRNLLVLSKRIQEQTLDARNTSEKVISTCFDRLTKISGQKENGQCISSGSFYDSRAALMRERMKVDRTVLTPFPKVNDLLFQGFAKGKVSILAARPKMGKTTLKYNLIRYWCEGGAGVYSYTPEQGLELERDGILANVSDVPIEYLWNPRVGDSGMSKVETESIIMKAEKEIDAWSLVIDGTRGKRFIGLMQDVKLEMTKRKIDILVIDMVSYLQDLLLAVQGRNYIIGNILRKQAEMAQELDIHILNIWHIHRYEDNKRAKAPPKPQMSNLQDSGACEKVCDLIMLVYRENFYVNTHNDSTELIVCPQRGAGESGMVRLQFVKPNKLIEYEEIDYDSDDTPF